jgi:hypothetical protein
MCQESSNPYEDTLEEKREGQISTWWQLVLDLVQPRM